MKNLFIALLAVMLIASCTKESNTELLTQDEILIDLREENIDVCHNGRIKSVKPKSLAKHLDHGDAVDMDGDGYFNKESDCGPVDCDDSDPGLTENCCTHPLFCDSTLLELVDIDSCDFYCSYSFNYGEYDCGGTTSEFFGEETYIEDFNCEGACYHYGQYYAYWHEFCGDIFTYVLFYYEDCDGTFEYVELYDQTIEQVQDARAIIDGWAADGGLTNICEDFEALPDGGTELIESNNRARTRLKVELPNSIQNPLSIIKNRRSSK